MKIRKLANEMVSLTGYPHKVLVAKNTMDMCKYVSNYMGRSPESWYNYYERFCNTNDYISGFGPIPKPKSYKTEKVLQLYGLHFAKFILLNKYLSKCNKKYIMFVILHEIGHFFAGNDEGAANEYAAFYLEKIYGTTTEEDKRHYRAEERKRKTGYYDWLMQNNL